MGNALSATGTGRDVWYHFHAVDVADSSCDHFDVHVSFTSNPGMAYDLMVVRGACTTAVMCPDCTSGACDSFTDYRFAVDMAGAGMTGQCPCTTGNDNGVNQCSDDGGEYYVRVRRVASAPAACAEYTLQVTNGMM
jgi:hypothetical protein